MVEAMPAKPEGQQLRVSFWDLCLDNIPEGAFVHRRVTPEEARRLIDEARRAVRLKGVSGEDLFAPYKKREKKNHGALCRVLGERHGIALALSDFVFTEDVDEDRISSIHPLQLFQIDESSRLIVVSCCYTLSGDRTDDGLEFDIDPTIGHVSSVRGARFG